MSADVMKSEMAGHLFLIERQLLIPKLTGPGVNSISPASSRAMDIWTMEAPSEKRRQCEVERKQTSREALAHRKKKPCWFA